MAKGVADTCLLSVFIGTCLYGPFINAQPETKAYPQPSPPPVGAVLSESYIRKESIPQLEVRAYNGDTTAAEALRAHYSYFSRDTEEAEYWIIIGALNGSYVTMLSLPRYIEAEKIEEKKHRLIRLAYWVYRKYHRAWPEAERKSVLEAFWTIRISLDK